MQRRFKAVGEGIDVDLTDNEKSFLTGLLDVLAGLPRTGDDPASRRLRVPVYLDDPGSNDEWWRLMGEELMAARYADRRVFQRVSHGIADYRCGVCRGPFPSQVTRLNVLLGIVHRPSTVVHEQGHHYPRHCSNHKQRAHSLGPED